MPASADSSITMTGDPDAIGAAHSLPGGWHRQPAPTNRNGATATAGERTTERAGFAGPVNALVIVGGERVLVIGQRAFVVRTFVDQDSNFRLDLARAFRQVLEVADQQQALLRRRLDAD